MEELLKILGIQDSPFVVTFGAICLAIIGIASFSESLQKLFVLKKEIFPVVEQKYKKIDISRRGFIISVASAGAVIVGGYLLIGFSKVKKLFFFISKPNEDGYLIANRKNGVIHHSKLCSWHLPKKTNQVLDLGKIKNPRPHKFRGINIYEVIAKQYISNKEYGKGIRYLKKAIDETPERVHLYDRLAKLYGMQKEYALIPKLYENGMKKVSSKMSFSQNKRQLKKVANDLKSRSDRIKIKHISTA